MLILIIANWIVIGLVGSAMVYALALAVYDLVADVKRSRALQVNSDLYNQLLLDDVYYRESYAELFSRLAFNVEMDSYPYFDEIDECCDDDYCDCDECDCHDESSATESIRELLKAVNQFIDDSKVVR